MKNFTKNIFSKTTKLFLLVLLCSNCFEVSAQTFSTPGSYSVTVPAGITIMAVTVTGAAGGTSVPSSVSASPGKGGMVSATYNVTPGTTYYIYVGAKAVNTPGGAGGGSFGGGEDGGSGGSTGPGDGAGGGAASDIRTTSGVLGSRIVVGGGGGGGGSSCSIPARGGNGGNPASAGAAGGGGCSCVTPGGAGTLAAGGAAGGCSSATAGTLGAGGIAGSTGEGGGGGGYYGGGGAYEAGGGGGSSYASPTGLVGSATYTNGTNTGDGSVTICFSSSPIIGPGTVCAGGTIALTDATPGGTWSSSNTLIATISGTGVVYGVIAGSITISYTTASCPALMTITVIGLSPITGSTSVCTGSSITLSDASAGGVWSSGNTAVATVSGSTITGVSAGTAVITYTSGSCYVTTTITVSSGSISPITGPTIVCPGSTIALSDATASGIWSSGNTTLATISGSGVVSGVTAGTTNISYTVGACAVGVLITVAPLSAITGTTSLCTGATTTLSNATPGGTWSSSNTSRATVVPGTGAVTGVSAGTAVISYTVGSCFVTTTVTISSSTISAITGPTTVCVGSTIALSDATPGGTWSSSNTAAATISGTGIVSGASAGSTTIIYSAGGCTTSLAMTIDVSGAGTITGKDSLCAGPLHQIVVSDNISGGTWSSSNTALATIDPVTGVITGITTGAFTITYSVTNTCGTFTATRAMYVRTATQCATGAGLVSEMQSNILKIFPNPNRGTFTMNLLSDIDEEVYVVVSSVVGAKVKEFKTTTNSTVDIKLDSAAGVYLISASSKHGKYVCKIVIY